MGAVFLARAADGRLMTSSGTCPAKPAAFAKWLKANPRGLVAVTTTGGVTTKLAEMYTP